MALSDRTFINAGGAISDLFGGFATSISDKDKAAGFDMEASMYARAAKFVGQEEDLSKASSKIQNVQADRAILKSIGGQESDVAGAGFAASGSALDLLRDSAQQGALTHQLVTTQGNINVLNLEQQKASYESLSEISANAAASEKKSGFMGLVGGLIGGGLKIGATLASFL